jgi:hypothetical protein
MDGARSRLHSEYRSRAAAAIAAEQYVPVAASYSTSRDARRGASCEPPRARRWRGRAGRRRPRRSASRGTGSPTSSRRRSTRPRTRGADRSPERAWTTARLVPVHGRLGEAVPDDGALAGATLVHVPDLARGDEVLVLCAPCWRSRARTSGRAPGGCARDRRARPRVLPLEDEVGQDATGQRAVRHAVAAEPGGDVDVAVAGLRRCIRGRPRAPAPGPTTVRHRPQRAEALPRPLLEARVARVGVVLLARAMVLAAHDHPLRRSTARSDTDPPCPRKAGRQPRRARRRRRSCDTTAASCG